MPQIGGTPTSIEAFGGKVTDRDGTSTDRLISQPFTSENRFSTATNSTKPSMSLKKTTLANNADDFDRIEISKHPKTKATQEISPDIHTESAVEILQKGRKVFTPMLVRRETTTNISDEYMVPLNELHDSAKEKGEFSGSGIFFL